MTKEQRTDHTARRHSSADIERVVSEGLSDYGYQIVRHDSQRWETCYSLSRKDTDGTIALFFGPLRDDDADYWVLPYEIIHEGNSEEGNLRFGKSANAETCAGSFLHHISDKLTNKLPITTHQDTHVGVGLERIPNSARQDF